MATTNPPVITPEQRAAALEKARETRARRAEIRDGITTGRIKFSELLKMDDAAATKMRVSAAIKAIPGYGPAKTEKTMIEIGIAPDKKIGGLGERQKAALVELFG